MARYTGPLTKKSRRLGVDLVGGDAAFERRPYPPGQHGRARIKESEYRTQLQEKQKARYTYGVLEKQFRKYYELAHRKPGKTGDNLLSLLESDAAGVVAERATPEQLQALEALHKELEDATSNRDRFFAINERFHMLLLELADNRWRSQMVADLRKVMKLNRHNSLLKQGRIEDSLREHRTILAAMLARDAQATVQAMQAHFAQGLEAAA